MNNKSWIVILIILVVILGLTVGYLLYDKYVVNMKENNVEENIIKKDETNDKKLSFVPFNNKNVQNSEGETFELAQKISSDVSVSMKDDGIYISISNQGLKMLDFTKPVIKPDKDYKVEGISKKVVTTFIYNRGQALDIPCVLLLLEDGTVESVGMNNGFKTGNFKSNGILENYTNVVRFEEVLVTSKDGKSGYHNAVIIQADGKAFNVPVIK
ncbi:MAG: hypothetical protein RSE41_02000 [Clostridia bacterium]